MCTLSRSTVCESLVKVQSSDMNSKTCIYFSGIEDSVSNLQKICIGKIPISPTDRHLLFLSNSFLYSIYIYGPFRPNISFRKLKKAFNIVLLKSNQKQIF